MKWPLRSHPSFAVLALLAILGVSCTTTTNTTVVNSLMPTITRLSPDTVWTFRTDTIYGTNFGYDANDVRASIDTTRVQINSIDDTMMTVYVPETAHTSFVHVRAYEQTGTSPERLFVNYSFYPHPIADSVPIGGSFSIPGTGMNNYHGMLRHYP